MLDTLINKYLPDFTKVKISKEEAAEQLYQALCKQARAVGHDPAWEVSKQPYKDSEYFKNEGIMVSYEAGPYLFIQGTDADGNLTKIKLHVTGGMLKVIDEDIE